jgi:uncharacterized protein Veg
MNSIKLETIKNIILSFQFENQWKIKDIKEKIKLSIGEEVGLNISYKKDVIINEVLNKAEVLKVIDVISITFTDVDDKIKTVDFTYNNTDNTTY